MGDFSGYWATISAIAATVLTVALRDPAVPSLVGHIRRAGNRHPRPAVPGAGTPLMARDRTRRG